MKRLVALTILCCVFSFLSRTVEGQASGQAPIRYEFARDLSYRESDDEYAKERCKLDLYYPKSNNADDGEGNIGSPATFATVVWFHGGGLTGGKKTIPEKLKEQGIAVAAPNYRLYPRIKAPVYICLLYTSPSPRD